MKKDYVTKDAIPNLRGSIMADIEAFIASGEECMVYTCDSREEVARLYQTIYANVTRRHSFDVKLHRHGLKLYVINKVLDNIMK